VYESENPIRDTSHGLITWVTKSSIGGLARDQWIVNDIHDVSVIKIIDH
jgi:hypothetical protein